MVKDLWNHLTYNLREAMILRIMSDILPEIQTIKNREFPKPYNSFKE